MRTEINDLATLRTHREAGNTLCDAVLVGLDLTDPEADGLLNTAMDGAVLLGCELVDRSRRRAEAGGALLFPTIPDVPYRVYRNTLYTTSELFAGFEPDRPSSYHDTLDARVYEHTRRLGRRPDPVHALAERLHDHAITEALTDTLAVCAAAGRAAPVAVMGGHALTRDSAGYRAAVDLGIAIGLSDADFTVLTGGGPGAMEAVPLGVRLAHRRDEVDRTLRKLANAPRFGNGSATADPAEIGRWVGAGLEVGLAPTEQPPSTIGIPTWFYGHEPPNPFCAAHAKYFANSVREDGLLTVATGGIIYTPGSAGTVQEVFQDYTQNHYASVGPAAPMIFLGREFWTDEVPAVPLVRRLSREREAEEWIVVTDDAAEAVAVLEKYARTPR